MAVDNPYLKTLNLADLKPTHELFDGKVQVFVFERKDGNSQIELLIYADDKAEYAALVEAMNGLIEQWQRDGKLANA